MNIWGNSNRIAELSDWAKLIIDRAEWRNFIEITTLVSKDINAVLWEKTLRLMKQKNVVKMSLEEGVSSIISQLEKLLLAKTDWKPIVLLIAWWSSSGKTSKVSEEVLGHFKKGWIGIQILSMDNFYFGPKYMQEQNNKWNPLNYDQPESINIALLKEKLELLKQWKTVKTPEYNFKDDPVPDSITINPSKIIIVEWLFTLQDGFGDIWDLWVFVEVSPHGRLIRRIIRDSLQWRSGKTPTQVFRDVLKEVEPMDDKYIKPQINTADIVIVNDYHAPREAFRIQNTESQTKYSFNNWEGTTTIPFLKIKRELIALWFEILPWSKHIDTFFESSHWYDNNWEVFRLRKSSKKDWSLQITYKYAEKKWYNRVESIISFPIEESDRELLKKYYKEIWKVTKHRIKFVRGWITITTDFDIILKLSWEKEINVWNYLEIQWEKNNKELRIYQEIVEWIVGNLSTEESYFDMMHNLKNK